MIHADFCALVELHSLRFQVLLDRAETYEATKLFPIHIEQYVYEECAAVQNIMLVALGVAQEGTDDDFLEILLEKLSQAINGLNVRLNERVLAVKN